MRKIFYGSTLFFVCLMFCSCRETQFRERYLNGWHLITDIQNERITLSHDSLGIVLDDIQLQVLSEVVKTDLKGWKIKRFKQGLEVHTDNPVTSSWTFKLLKNRIIVSSSAEGSCITAIAPAPWLHHRAGGNCA